ncbi:MAG: selenium-dependent molybdenum cofactor biosynthesis protein YqeB [Pseudomonadota bacterium]
MFSEYRIIVKGGGDLASAVAHKLFRAGFPVIITELEKPMMVRRNVSFANCIYEGEWTVEGITSVLTDAEGVEQVLAEGRLPVVIDPRCSIRRQIKPTAIVDAILAKENLGTKLDDAPVVIGLGPGFAAGEDVDAVIETNRGHDLARVLLEGRAERNTGIPGAIKGYTSERVLRSPCEGKVENKVEIGAMVKAGDIICTVAGNAVYSQIDGVVRGLIRGGLRVSANTKIGDIDPRGDISYCNTISDKGRNIAGGVLEAALMLLSKL